MISSKSELDNSNKENKSLIVWSPFNPILATPSLLLSIAFGLSHVQNVIRETQGSGRALLTKERNEGGELNRS